MILLCGFVFWEIRSFVAIAASVNQVRGEDCVRSRAEQGCCVVGEISFFQPLPGWTAVDLGQLSFQLNQLKHANWKESKYKLQWVDLLMKEHFILVCIKAFSGEAFFVVLEENSLTCFFFSLGWVLVQNLILFLRKYKIPSIISGTFNQTQSRGAGEYFTSWVDPVLAVVPGHKKQGWDDDKRLGELLKGFVNTRAIKYSG